MKGGIYIITGAILEKGEERYTYLKKIFDLLSNFQKNYNWLITDCEATPKREGHSERITQGKYGKYAWIDGEELTNIIKKDDFQWIWAVLSGFDKCFDKEEMLKYKFPYADGYKGFWQKEITIQHPFASVEIVAWDASLTLIISEEEEIVKKFRKAFPLSKDLKEYNNGIVYEDIEYKKWLCENSYKK